MCRPAVLCASKCGINDCIINLKEAIAFRSFGADPLRPHGDEMTITSPTNITMRPVCMERLTVKQLSGP
jgi:hypothetical protein